MKALRLLAVLAAVAGLAPAAHAVDPSLYDPSRIVTPPLHKIPSIRPERWVMPNGMVVYLLENHDLPRVRGTAYFKSSPALVPADRAGLAGLAGEVMRSGGTVAHPGDALDDRLAAIGASVSTNVGADVASGSFSCLTENSGEVLALLGDVLRHPAFPDEKLEVAKVGARRAIASRNDEMFSILFRISAQGIFGKDSPWARTPEYATIEPITADDCRGLHDAVFVPERAIMTVYGDFKASDVKRLLTGVFGNWKRSGTPAPVLPPVPTSVKPRLVFAPKNDVTQSGIVLAQMGHRVDDPDYAAMQVLEQGLGGGFSSRMFSYIRTTRGLAYATGASAGADYARPGVFLAYSLTKSESTMVALDLVREQVKRVTEAPFTPEELATAKQAVQNGFVFKFADPAAVLGRTAYYETVGYPADFLDRYQKALDQVTAESVLAAARRKIQPDQMVAMIVGNEREFDRPLDSAGLSVERLDITIPPPPSKLAVGAATPEALAKGRAMLEKAAAASGGSPAWAAVTSIVTEQSAQVTLQGQSVQIDGSESWLLPDKQLSVQRLPFGEMRQGTDGRIGWMSAMGQLQESPKIAESVAEDWERSLFRLFGRPGEMEAQALDAHHVHIKSERIQDLVVGFDEDGRLATIEYQGDGPGGGVAKMVMTFSDWKPVGALQYPHDVQIEADGKPFLTSTLKSIKLNERLDDSLFAKPAQ